MNLSPSVGSLMLSNELTPAHRRQFALLQLFRSLLLVSIIVFLAETIELGTGLIWLVPAAIAGVLIAGRSLRSGRSFWSLAVVHAAALMAIWLVLAGGNVLITGGASKPTDDFLVFRYGEHLKLIIIVYIAGLLTSWFFWRARSAVTWEAAALGSMFIWLLSGHRNYHLDAPKNVSDVAWALGVAPQHLLLGLAALFTLILGIYFALAHERPLFGQPNPVRTASKVRRVIGVATPLLLMAMLFGFAVYINQAYSSDLSRASNGVGTEGKQEGESPLGFHSAIGQTRQPAALVRLEGDFPDNPWSPMLYLREGALSSFSGREMVVANKTFDRDVPRVAPGEPFVAIVQENKEGRREMLQSIYLLAPHMAPFAIDYPLSIRLIQNPDENRFNLAYQAESLAPVSKLDELIGEEVGDSNWDDVTWAHYLRAPGSDDPPAELSGYDLPVLSADGEDLRYRALAAELTAGIEAPVLKAIAITEYLSKESIYTRQPGHAPTSSGDPVAPYLFSDDMKGYCVHFAHAAVYLMRLSGIPARIATGYLTDLTYAKDGHILLHLGDRHAWPEIYVRGRGWTVVDVMPANAENEQVIIPDEKLLEELMNQIDPAHELVAPPPPAPDEPADRNSLREALARPAVITLLTMLLLTFIAVKAYLRFGWRLFVDSPRGVMLGYASAASLLADVGLPRRHGETKREYAERVRDRYGVDAAAITLLTERTKYGHPVDFAHAAELREALTVVGGSFDSSKSRLRRIIAFFSPRSLTRFGRW